MTLNIVACLLISLGGLNLHASVDCGGRLSHILDNLSVTSDENVDLPNKETLFEIALRKKLDPFGLFNDSLDPEAALIVRGGKPLGVELGGLGFTDGEVETKVKALRFTRQEQRYLIEVQDEVPIYRLLINVSTAHKRARVWMRQNYSAWKLVADYEGDVLFSKEDFKYMTKD